MARLFIARTIGTVGAPPVTPPVDTTPNAFSFLDATGVSLGATMTSAPITVTGINAPATMTVSGGVYYKNGGAASAVSTTVVAGDTVSVGHTASSSNSTAVNTILTIGGVSDTFTSTTLAGSGANDGTPAPDMALTSASTAYPVTVAATYLPAYHVVGDVLRVAVYATVTESGGKILPSGTPSINTTITLVATAATNASNLNAALSSVASGTGYVFVRIEHGTVGDWSIPLQFGTAAVPALTSSASIATYETVTFASNLIFGAPVRGIILRGQDGGSFELVDAVPGSSFALRYAGGGSRTRPALDFNRDNIWDVTLEATGLNGVVASTPITVALNAILATAFDFADVTGVALNARGVSPTTVTVSGLPPGLSVPVTTTGEVSKDGGTTWASSGVTVQNGDTLKASKPTSGPAATASVSVSYGGQTDTFQVTNAGYVVPATPLTFSSVGSPNDIVLSSGDLRADKDSGPNNPGGARANVVKTSGSWTFGLEVTAIGSVNYAWVGAVVTSARGLNAGAGYPGGNSDTSALVLYSDGTVQTNGATLNTPTSLVVGSGVVFCFKKQAAASTWKVWIGKVLAANMPSAIDGDINWNNVTWISGDPAADTGGYTVTTFADIAPAWFGTDPGAAAIIRSVINVPTGIVSL